MSKPYYSPKSCSPSRSYGGSSKKAKRIQKTPKALKRSPNALKRSPNALKSCFSYQSLARIARRYNEANPHDKIKMYRTTDKLWKEIKKHMPECDNERCWTRARYLSDDDRQVLLEDFKPPIPQGKYTWLTTDDINRVLMSYEKVFSNFVFLGTHPIDFQSLGIMDFATTINSLPKNTNAALILNLDNSNQPGSHWVAVYFDGKNRTMEYFDSFGDAAPRQVKELLSRLNARPRNGWKYKENKRQHQRGNSECGVYAINFIVQRLSGRSFNSVVNNVTPDSAMNKKRSTYFDPYSN